MIREMNPVPGGLLQRGMPTVAAAYQSPPPPQLQQARSSPRTSPTQQQQQVASNLPPGIPLVPQQQYSPPQQQYSMNQQLLLLGRQGLQTTPGYTPPGTPPDFEYASNTPNVRLRCRLIFTPPRYTLCVQCALRPC